ncbi:hypothetical protein [Spelaeicoccus albus]|nr:hypothetical protein [Spelaeicoccus albus]
MIAAVAEQLGLVHRPSLPPPIRGLDDAAYARVGDVIDALEIRAAPNR